MTEEQKPECIPIDDDNDDDGGGGDAVDGDAGDGVSSEPEEWSVEAIRNKRKNPETGITEFLIKWEGWAEADNSWEPIDNLKCPALIAEFEEEQRRKRQRRSNATRASSSSKLPATKGRPKKGTLRSSNINSNTNGQSAGSFLLENDVDEVSNSTERPPSTNPIEDADPTPENNHSKDLTESAWQQPKGFGRGVKIEKIVGSCVDDKDKLFFFIKWADLPDLEMVDANEIEDKAPKKLCKWYRERLYFAIKNPLEPPVPQPSVGPQLP